LCIQEFQRGFEKDESETIIIDRDRLLTKYQKIMQYGFILRIFCLL
jgi:hypothetical protein